MIRRFIFLLCLFPQFVFSQSENFRGVLYDQETRIPIPNAHLKIKNSNRGTITGSDGSFVLIVKSLPVNIEITCMGYEILCLEVTSIQEAPVSLFMKPKTFTLAPVIISDAPAVVLYKDEDYSVLDYGFLEKRLMLLVFRYQLKRSEIVLMNLDGDTLNVSTVPSTPAEALYKDVFANIHYITKNNQAYQAFYQPEQNNLTFPYRTSYDTIQKYLGGFRFLIGDRLYFQENDVKGFRTFIGYYSRKEGRIYARRSVDVKGMKTFYTDSPNYHTIRVNPEPIDENDVARGVDDVALAYQQFYKKNGCGESFRMNDTMIVFFNFCENKIELLNPDGLCKRSVPIDFHLYKTNGWLATVSSIVAGSDQWKWSQKLIQDEVFGDIYAIYSNNGFTRLKKINLENGILGNGVDLPYAFPEKIKIFMGEAYFLYRGIGEHEKWKLYKIVLDKGT